MIIYNNEDGRNIEVSVSKNDTAVLRVKAFEQGGIQFPAKSFDLSYEQQWDGVVVRIFAEYDGTYTVENTGNAHYEGGHYWQLMELALPPKEMLPSEGMTEGQQETEYKEPEVKKLDLNGVDILVYELEA